MKFLGEPPLSRVPLRFMRSEPQVQDVIYLVPSEQVNQWDTCNTSLLILKGHPHKPLDALTWGQMPRPACLKLTSSSCVLKVSLMWSIMGVLRTWGPKSLMSRSGWSGSVQFPASNESVGPESDPVPSNMNTQSGKQSQAQATHPRRPARHCLRTD